MYNKYCAHSPRNPFLAINIYICQGSSVMVFIYIWSILLAWLGYININVSVEWNFPLITHLKHWFIWSSYRFGAFTNVIHWFYEIFTIQLEYWKISGNGPKLFIMVQQNTKFPPLRLSSMQFEAKLNGFHFLSKVTILFSF